ncbi:TonB family protein [Flavobacterium jejuense]|uniref:TonB family protein n=1 Tax=Flavobacterium jejuense TaxID=1544455 RepID=A0ABX0IWB0_9FLAO|nr:TonB family protein [Flavobacterium jejuense]NHN27481.1 TonB family protein [Flavobacterium jejuense]
MRAKDDFKKKTKNSFIYFQLGLIATMVVALFVLEFNFKDVKKIYKPNSGLTPIEETVFVYNPAEPEVPAKVKPVVAKPIARVEPQVKVHDVLNDFDIKKDDEVVVKQDLATQDDSQTAENPIDTTPTTESASGNTDAANTSPNIFSVEQLPMFKACKGLLRSEQKACFDEQLAKAISRNLTYPERDYENRKQGTALIEFIIDENGNITNVKPLENNRATEDMKKAAEKAVKKIPQLIPAKQGKKNVRIKYAIPITFKLN